MERACITEKLKSHLKKRSSLWKNQTKF